MRKESSKLQDIEVVESLTDKLTPLNSDSVQSGQYNSLQLSRFLDPDELGAILVNIETTNLSHITHPNTLNLDTRNSVLLIVDSALNLAGFWSSTDGESNSIKNSQLQERIISAYDTYMNDYSNASGTADIDKIIKDLYDNFSDKAGYQQTSAEPAILQILHLLKSRIRSSPIIDDYFTKAERVMRLMILNDVANE